jgi:hypothetical protein
MPDAVILSPWRNSQAHRCQRQRRAGALACVACQCALYKFPPGWRPPLGAVCSMAPASRARPPAALGIRHRVRP